MNFSFIVVGYLVGFRLNVKLIVLGKLNKWLLSGVFWLMVTLLSLISLIVFFGRDSIFLHNSGLALIPITFQGLMCASFISYLLERKPKRIHVLPEEVLQ